MKQITIILIAAALTLFLVPQRVLANSNGVDNGKGNGGVDNGGGNGNGGGASVPVNNGIGLLLAVGATYAIIKLYSNKKATLATVELQK